jgi:hypothetical protein
MGFIAGPRVTTATGGIINNIPGAVVHAFTTPGTFTFTPRGNGTVDVLVVGGGGGGSENLGANEISGGGGGSVFYQRFVPVLSGVSYSLNVGFTGAGTVAGTATTFRYNGGTITAGGGSGGVPSSASFPGNPNPVGSASGGSGAFPGRGGAGGIGNGNPGFGFPGGNGSDTFTGGGGGAGGAAIDNIGGQGLAYSITGVSTFYGGGGGGFGGGGSLHPTSTPSNFGLGGSGGSGAFFPDATPGCIFIRYLN